MTAVPAQGHEVPSPPQPGKDPAASEGCSAKAGTPPEQEEEEEEQQQQQQQQAGGGGEQADLPFDAPFAPLRQPFDFWQDAVLLCLLGGALGAFG